MSTNKLLRRFKALPAVQRKKFLRAALVSAARPASKGRSVSHVQWPDVEARARRIIGDRVLPNLVLAERADYAF